MYKEKIYAIAALFDNPDSIIEVAKRVKADGYTKFDVNTPYPLHGMDPAMGLKPSKIGYFTMAIGTFFASLMTYFIYWTNSVDYPQIIGGKPYFAFPSYLPVMFEAFILTSAVLSVVMMILYLFKFPNNSHPIHDSAFAKSTSSDMFGIYIEADDPKYDYDSIAAIFSEFGANITEPIYYDTEEVSWKPKIWDPKFITGLIALAAFTAFNVYVYMNILLFITPFDWMMNQPRTDYGETSEFFADGMSMRTPPEGTVAQGFMPYKYKGDHKSASENLSNPFTPTKEVLELGQKKFKTFCSHCHGDDGVAGRIPGMPGANLTLDMYKNMSDGMMYHIITQGSRAGLMNGHEAQITKDERWAIVHFVRVLQNTKSNEKISDEDEEEEDDDDMWGDEEDEDESTEEGE